MEAVIKFFKKIKEEEKKSTRIDDFFGAAFQWQTFCVLFPHFTCQASFSYLLSADLVLYGHAV